MTVGSVDGDQLACVVVVRTRSRNDEIAPGSEDCLEMVTWRLCVLAVMVLTEQSLGLSMVHHPIVYGVDALTVAKQAQQL